ncbi:50S ribosomal protein L6 [Candidatus Pacearchaeota archaeon CG09_land_8_20_14_0_10_30_9]|nr:50S ribosomal protein L6P [uncultured archaeon]KHO48873.1 MAG: hypothetical protein QJ16_C0002G0008 [archaeon GW2011_AR1]MBS3077980.1 50S ribosomal protein L6 [Candidatus Pacearchaeota archaeon]OIO40778.1 MAG: 50S ribosomal protein L6 [Candidatus Pacearchaeota archaeon CG1_02_30_18]PIN71688.1 MAG: 50S ribosomal protein L6 [Candidatus Pacearchaeota archaeon CG11_big_fil_rev_8_21_14_0_20_30_13]PIO00942.1 MAG: 50S ribosomal protein L6 [Candidatus Pacearchaeota archaeon CG09_land_8_20_14_0_10_3
MKKELIKKIKIPEGVSITIENSKFTAKGPEGELSREFNFGKVKMTIKDKEIILEQKNTTKNEKKVMNTIGAHIKNIVKGVAKKFEYNLKICYGHFPFTIRHDGNRVFIKNFLGEKVERVVELPKGIDIEIKKEIITIKSMDKELAGQASANFEKATKVRGRDIRRFQDGIYITEKDGKKM